ncbi:MAG: hypothetical protein IJ744_07475 [Lachnospiraceae bacterium]|nr:hypothetical protein [Lachnospiraceae bacterium]
MKKKVSGVKLAVIIFQVISLLPLMYFVMTLGYSTVVTNYGFFAWLFDLGIALLPRVEVLLVSLLYHVTKNEVAVYFAFVVTALIVGLVFERLMSGSEKTKQRTRMVTAVFIGIDLILRVLPLSVNLIQNGWFRAGGSIAAMICLILIILVR